MNTLGFIRIAACATLALSITAPPAPAQSPAKAKGPTPPETTYVFERMWPALQQPWYIDSPVDIDVDSAGNFYVVDTGKDTVLRFSSTGTFLTQWGGTGSGDGQFDIPRGIAVNGVDEVYVSDLYNVRVQKFDANGTFLAKWGSFGEGDGQFGSLRGLAVDPSNNVYVVSYDPNRIQKFNADGDFLGKWGGTGFGDGLFNAPEDIAIDQEGNVYVSDAANDYIQKFDSEGIFLRRWGTSGAANGQFDSPDGISVGSSGDLFIADVGNGRIQKFSPDGTFLSTWGETGFELDRLSSPWGVAVGRGEVVFVANYIGNNVQLFDTSGFLLSRWGSQGYGNGQFNFLYRGIAIGGDGHVYVTDLANHRVQVFDSDGAFIQSWGDGPSSASGSFITPVSLAFDANGNLYVLELTGRIQKFDSDWNVLASWGQSDNPSNLPGLFSSPHGIAISSDFSVYVADTDNHRIQKFDSEGNLLTYWGSLGTGQGEFDNPKGIAVDVTGNIYVADSKNHRVQKFDPDGTYLVSWGTEGNNVGQFDEPAGLALDDGGNIYIADTINDRLQVLDASGTSVNLWGGLGSGPGELSNPSDLAVDTVGNVFIVDANNNRIQKFRPVAIPPNARAIVVAAGGAFPGNNLWDATQFCANYAYRVLTFQGFTKETIYYLSSDLDLDLDGNGEPDDVDDDATNANLEYALTEWAAGADSLVVYLVDHGGLEKFRMSENVTLDASDFATWLAAAEATVPGKSIVVYEACQSGSFLGALGARKGSGERITITSASNTENAYFLSTGAISFSNFFWTQVFNGFTVGEAFTAATQSITQAIAFQTPQLDDNGNGTGNDNGDGVLAAATFIGNGTVVNRGAPEIVDASPNQQLDNSSSALLYADVSDPDGIARAWAVITPPDFEPPSPDNPVLDLPSVELFPVRPDGIETDPERWENTWNGFTSEGLYQIAIYARDRIGNTAIPALTTVTVGNPLARRAVLIAGGDELDPLWPGIQRASLLAYDTLRKQGFSDDEIYFLAPSAFSSGFDGTNVLDNIEFALTDWAAGQTQSLVFCYVGAGGNQVLTINDSEAIAAEQLDAWLDAIQNSIPGEVTVILDACQSGSFASVLKPPTMEKRIFVASTNETESAHFIEDGNVSFSRFFWQQIVNGATILDAFRHARNATRFTTKSTLLQTPQLDDDGNGVTNEAADGKLARVTRIGIGVLVGADDPVVGNVTVPSTLNGAATAAILVDDVTSTGDVALVWAVITPPDPSAIACANPYDATRILDANGDGSYGATYNAFSDVGEYEIAVYAMDGDGNVSLPVTATLTQQQAADPEVVGTLDADVSVVNFPQAGGERAVALSTGDAGDLLEWSADIQQSGSWLTMSISKPSGSGIIQLTADENATESQRSAILTIESPDADNSPITIPVYQSGITGSAPNDPNDDGKIDAIDIQLVINSVLGLTVAYNTDLNGDGILSASDIQLIINAALGL